MKISNLPPEILLQTFEVLTTISVDAPVYESRRKHPLALSWTCSRWRSLVLANAGLWRHVTISSDTTLEEVQMSLERSGSVPLIIDIESLSEDQMDIMRALIRHSNRWRIFRGSCLHDGLESTAFELLQDVEPTALEVLHLEADTVGEFTNQGYTIFNGSDTELPNLKELALTQVSISWGYHPFATPSLRTLHLEITEPALYVSTSHLVELLDLCSQLEELRLVTEYAEPDDLEAFVHDLETPVVLPALRRLTVNVLSGSDYLLNTLRLFSAPRLESLELSGTPLTRALSIVIEEIIEGKALAGSLRQVKQLKIAKLWYASREDWRSLLRHTEDVQAITIDNCFRPSSEDAIWLLQDLASTEPKLCPELESLHLDWKPEDEIAALHAARPGVKVGLCK